MRSGSIAQVGNRCKVEGEREWAKAFELWLAGKAQNTRRSYARAWENLLQCTGKHPCEILTGDVRAWAEDLGCRELDATVLLGLERNGRRSLGDGAEQLQRTVMTRLVRDDLG